MGARNESGERPRRGTGGRVARAKAVQGYRESHVSSSYPEGWRHCTAHLDTLERRYLPMAAEARSMAADARIGDSKLGDALPVLALRPIPFADCRQGTLVTVAAG